MIIADFSREAKLRDGRKVLLRPMRKGDQVELLAFFRRLTPEDRLFLKDDVSKPEVIASWVENLNFERVIPILAVADGKIVGDATLHRHSLGWSPHVGEIRIVTDPEYRRKGLGRMLAREIFLLAVHLGLEKVVAEMIEDQQAAGAVFASLGFKKEAVLHDHVVDQKGRKRNLVVMCHHIAVSWDRIEEQIDMSLTDRSGG